MNKRKLLPYLSLCLLLNVGSVACLFLSAQEFANFSNIQYLTSDEGLSQQEITCMLQDRQGFLWIGTRGGLNRYDGYSFKIFQNEIGNSNSLINNSIESLFEDSEGNIWIGTKSNGLSIYNPQTDRFRHLNEGMEDGQRLTFNRVIAIEEAGNGDIWIGTWEDGAIVIEKETGKFRHYLEGEKVSAIKKMRDGKIYLAAHRGLYLFSESGEILGNYGTSPAYAFVNITEERVSGKLYLGTWNQGLFEFDPKEKTFFQFKKQENKPGSISSNNAYRIFQDNKDRIWVGTWGAGLNLFDPVNGKFIRYNLVHENLNRGKELYNDVLSIYQDQSGIIWIGTNGGGICKVDERSSQFEQVRNSAGKLGVPREPIWGMMKDSEGVLWVGSKGSPYVYYSKDGKDFLKIKIPLGNPRSAWFKSGVRVLYQSPDGTRWFTTQMGLFKLLGTYGAYEIQQVKIRDQEKEGTVNQRQISSMFQASDGYFWIGKQQDGLKKSLNPGLPDKQEFKAYEYGEAKGQLKSNRISTFLEDQSGNLWVGTYGGLYKYQSASDDFLSFCKKQGDIQSLSSDIVICLHEDQKGNLWVGTPNGLNLAIPQGDSLHFKCFQEKDGLPNNYIQSILEDDQGNLWLSTNKGISKFDVKDGVFYNYDVTDGLQSNPFMERAALKDEEGKLYFGGIYGLTYFHPDSIQSNSSPPPVFLTGLKILNKEIGAGKLFNERVILPNSIEYSKEVQLNYNENVFSIDYTALDFHAPLGNTYRYKMEGLEKEWNLAGPKRSVTYSNLKPGTYTFRVKAANNEGIWNEKGAQLKIVILPPFWATWQAFVLYALVFAGLLLLYKYIIGQQNELKNKLDLSRLEREKELELTEMKARFFTNITHELRTPLTLISGPVDEIMSTNKLNTKLKNYMLTIHQNTQRLLGLVNQLLDFRKAESGNMKLDAAPGDFAKFSREVFLSFQGLAEQRGIEYQFNTSDEKIPLFYDRDKMEIVLCNLLSNAFKYVTEDGKISFSIHQYPANQTSSKFAQGYCEIRIKDNGLGMPEGLLDKVFDRFYQIANTDSVKLVGTGIGLSLAKSIIDLHHGDVSVESKMGKGSCFKVKIPLGSAHLSKDQLLNSFRDSEHGSHYQENRFKESSGMIAEEKMIPLEDRAKLSLLLVEDNAEIRDFIRAIFSDTYKIYEAKNGKIGLGLALQHIPDLIISDLMMPEMDGLSFCKYVKQDESTSHIPVILLTARTANVFQVEGYQSGADAFVGKPFHPAVLKAQVNALLASRQKLKEYFEKKITLDPNTTEIDSLDERFLNKAMKLVEDNINNGQLCRDFIADEMAMSPSSLYRKLKSLTGLTTNAFIRSVRLKKAGQLLRESQYNISEIAYMVGFNDQKYFRTSFREQFGVNPSEYVKKVR